MFINVAVALQVRSWEAPCRWIWCPRSDIGRNGAPWEKPYADVVRCPLHSVYSATNGIEPRSIAASPWVEHATSNIVTWLGVGSISATLRSGRHSHNTRNRYAADYLSASCCLPRSCTQYYCKTFNADQNSMARARVLTYVMSWHSASTD